MIDDPAIPANILEILFIVLGLAAFFIGALAGLRRIATILVRRREHRRRMNEPVTYGDDGGRPVQWKGLPPSRFTMTQRRAGDMLHPHNMGQQRGRNQSAHVRSVKA